MAARRLAFNSPSTPLRGHQLSASPQTDEKKLLKALSGSSRQLQQQTTDINERFAPLERSGLCGFLSMEERNRLKEEETGARSHDREAVRRLHNSETNYRRHEPEQGCWNRDKVRWLMTRWNPGVPPPWSSRRTERTALLAGSRVDCTVATRTRAACTTDLPRKTRRQ
ncbi:uncharacterized protein LOC144388836 [Gasterosteus aculeatus]